MFFSAAASLGTYHFPSDVYFVAVDSGSGTVVRHPQFESRHGVWTFKAINCFEIKQKKVKEAGDESLNTI